MTGWLLLGGAALVGWGSGMALRRSRGWTPALQRFVVLLLLAPWWVQHLALVRVSRSAALNPLRGAAGGPVLPADLAAPLLLAVALLPVLLRPGRFRYLAPTLPLLASILTWWVTLPLYAEVMMRGWVFLPPVLGASWVQAYLLAAATLLAGYVYGAPAPPAGPGAGTSPGADSSSD